MINQVVLFWVYNTDKPELFVRNMPVLTWPAFLCVCDCLCHNMSSSDLFLVAHVSAESHCAPPDEPSLRPPAFANECSCLPNPSFLPPPFSSMSALISKWNTARGRRRIISCFEFHRAALLEIPLPVTVRIYISAPHSARVVTLRRHSVKEMDGRGSCYKNFKLVSLG